MELLTCCLFGGEEEDLLTTQGLILEPDQHLIYTLLELH